MNMASFLLQYLNCVSCLCAEADLRIRELQWGDSGVYYCKVVIADDLEGRNEAQVELLVLGMPHSSSQSNKTKASSQELTILEYLFCCYFAM